MHHIIVKRVAFLLIALLILEIIAFALIVTPN